MSNVDKSLQELGFVLVDHDDVICYWVYENKKEGQRVDIDYDGENWFVSSKTITEQRDWFGQLYNECMGLRYDEMKLFMEKIEELKTREQQV